VKDELGIDSRAVTVSEKNVADVQTPEQEISAIKHNKTVRGQMKPKTKERKHVE